MNRHTHYAGQGGFQFALAACNRIHDAIGTDGTADSVSPELIRVRTDVLEVAIDPRGGDIVQLKLPKFPRRQDHPEVPFQLFDNGSERLYLAQSGLTGANGPDARASGRPLYASEQRSYRLADGQDALVVDLKFSEAGVDYTKRFTFKRGAYDLEVRHLIARKLVDHSTLLQGLSARSRDFH